MTCLLPTLEHTSQVAGLDKQHAVFLALGAAVLNGYTHLLRLQMQTPRGADAAGLPAAQGRVGGVAVAATVALAASGTASGGGVA